MNYNLPIKMQITITNNFERKKQAIMLTYMIINFMKFKGNVYNINYNS